MDVGMPTLIEIKSLDENAALCRELGLQFIELNMNLPQYQLDRFDITRFAEISEQYGIYYIIHLDENLNVSDFNTRIANAYMETVLETIGIAKQLKIPVLNMHMADGVYFTLPEQKVYLFEKYKDFYLQNLKAFRDNCTSAIGDADIRICIENSNGWNKTFLQDGILLLLESPVFGLTFDIGHNASIGGIDEPFIISHSDKLHHMHIHDARQKSNHLPLGTGELDLQYYFSLAKQYSCRTVLETKTIAGLRQSVEWVKENFHE